MEVGVKWKFGMYNGSVQWMTLPSHRTFGYFYGQCSYSAMFGSFLFMQKPLHCLNRGVSLIAGLDSPLEHGTGMWDWII